MAPTLLLINPAMDAGNGAKVPAALPGDCSRAVGRGGTRRGRRRPAHAGGAISMEPLALAYVAALTPPHWQVRIVDEVEEDLPDGLKPDLVALTALTISVPRAYEIAQHYRQQGVPVVLGGVHATLVPDEAQRYVDVVYQGEAESSWPALIADFEAGKLKARYNGGAISGGGEDGSPRARNVCRLENLPLPRRSAYGRSYLLQLVSASRGCVYRCEFCSLWKMEAGQYRARPPLDVVAELATTSRRPILFTDENVFVDREWALALFREIARRGVRRSFAVQASLDVASDDEMLAALKESGCMTVLVGLESLNEESLRLMRKGVNLKIGVAGYADSIRRLHQRGLAVSGTFIFGYDGDGPDTFRRTVDFVLETGLDIAHFGLLTPIPGTDLYDRLAREDRLLYTDFPGDYSRYDLRTAVFRPARMTPEELEAGLAWAARAVGSLGVTVRRTWRTWRSTGSLLMAALALGWNRTGLYRRVLDGRSHKAATQLQGE
jgi:radical SAM superfamily enzyme YgiQ (UPF0313 family)